MRSRYIANDFSPLLTLAAGEPERHLKQALEDIVTQLPPREDYSGERLSGLWSGPTGFACLFLHVSRRHPHLDIGGHHALTWARRYLAGARGEVRLDPRRCGIGCEKLALDAVRACVTQDPACVGAFTSSIPQVVDSGDAPGEMLNGRAGTLYMLRMMRAWVPGPQPLVEQSIQSVTAAILADGPDWEWHGERYLGAVHGDIGIVTQLVLTTPSLAEHMESKMAQLLDMQLPNGNWPVSVASKDCSYALVQFCHGAPGILHSLVALRPYFPRLEQKIDVAIEKGRQCIWREGLLVKEPSMCHGIFGNALVLSRGPQRDHFLALATPEQVSTLRDKDRRVFEPADYGRRYATISGYLASAVWAWMGCGEESPGLAFYTDV